MNESDEAIQGREVRVTLDADGSIHDVKVVREPVTAEDHLVANMKAVRERYGWSQGELAKRLQAEGQTQMHQTTVSRIEKRERSVRVDEALTIARVLGKSLEALLEPPKSFGAAERLTALGKAAASAALDLQADVIELRSQLEALDAEWRQAFLLLDGGSESGAILLSVRLAMELLGGIKGEEWRHVARESGLGQLVEEADRAFGEGRFVDLMDSSGDDDGKH